jgi:hypothetical protein
MLTIFGLLAQHSCVGAGSCESGVGEVFEAQPERTEAEIRLVTNPIFREFFIIVFFYIVVHYTT